jgi:hypothetical protein
LIIFRDGNQRMVQSEIRAMTLACGQVKDINGRMSLINRLS